MAEQDPVEAANATPPDLSAYAQDLITLWQSELAAMATDREIQEGFQRGLTLWGMMAQNFAQYLPKPAITGGPQRETPRRAGAAAPPWSASHPAASDARDRELARLAERIAELERQLGELRDRS